MSQSQEPSLLEYARFHGIATNPTTIDPLEYIDQTFNNSDFFHYEGISSFENHLSTIQASIEQDLRMEKLNVNKEDAQFLSTVIRNARAERVDVNWDDCLPSMRRIEGLKVEIPALATHHETDMASLRQHTFFGRAGGALSLVKGCSSYPTADCSDDFVKMSLELDDKIRMERLNCTKGSLILIQKARKSGIDSPRDMDFDFETLLRLYQGRSFEPGLPLNPIDFDELYSPPPTPKPQMLPSPISLNRFEQHGMQYGIPKTGTPASSHSKSDRVGESRISSSLGSDNRELLVIQVGEKLRLSNERQPTPIEQPYQLPLIAEKESNQRKTTGIGNEDVCNDVRHQLGSQLPIQGEGASLESVLLPEQASSTHGQSASLSPTYHSILLISPRKTRDNGDHDTLLGRSMESHHRDITAGAHTALSEMTNGSEESPNETHIGANTDSQEGNDRNRSTSQVNPSTELMDPTSTRQKSEEQCVSPIPEPTSIPELSNVIEKTASYGQRVPACPADQLSVQRKKRKDSNRDSTSRKQQRRSDQRGPVIQSRAVNKDLSSPFTALGSLSSFMETRGKATVRQVNAKSPYFANSSNQLNDNQDLVADTPTESHIEPDIQKEEQVSIASTIPTHHIPQYPRNNQKPPLLFLSTTLLKSHRRLVRILESIKHPSPVLIYREYDKGLLRTTNNKSITHGLQHEADIITSPSTGILLTTSQATTQLYLPGHKPSHPQLRGINGINSPLRERIMLLAPRYERLYIFICHSGGMAKKQPQGKSTGSTADKRTLASMTSLMAFCSSAMDYSTIIPLLITPSAPENVAEWILSLACKHSFELPEPNLSQGTTGFTPINRNMKKAKLNPESMETETQWELFLRRAGLNPFSAQAILAVLRREEENEVGGLRLSGGSVAGESMNIPALLGFIEMTTEQRRRLFAGLIGDKVWRRIEGMVDNDWQCDWALNFDASTQ